MLHITIPETELYDERTNEFIHIKSRTIALEHSLVSISKWEAKWCKPFLSKEGMTEEQTIDYIRCMTLTQNVPPETYKGITNSIINEVAEYINAPMTATWFSEEKSKRPSREVVTSEVIYWWMIALNIPHKYEKWHLNRLLTLVRVCDIKNTPSKKMGKNALANQYAALNAARKKKFNTKG